MPWSLMVQSPCRHTQYLPATSRQSNSAGLRRSSSDPEKELEVEHGPDQSGLSRKLSSTTRDGEELEDEHGLEKSGLSRKQSSTTRNGGQVSSQIHCRTSTGRSENDGRGLFTPWAVQLANVRCTISSERREQYQMSWC